MITGYGARIDREALGLDISAFITVRLGRQTPKDIQAFLSAVARAPEITECVLVTGNLDYVLRVVVENTDALREFILSGLKTLPCVSETTTMLVLEVSKSE